MPHELSNDLRLLVLSILHYTKNEVFHKGLVFIVSFKHISHFVLVFLLLTLNMQLQAGNRHCGSWDLKAQSQFLATESRLKGMKNAFYFTVKTLFVLKIFHFLSWFFGHVEIYDVTTWKANNCLACPSPLFLGNAHFYIGFSWTFPIKVRFSVNTQNIKVFHSEPHLIF